MKAATNESSFTDDWDATKYLGNGSPGALNHTEDYVSTKQLGNVSIGSSRKQPNSLEDGNTEKESDKNDSIIFLSTGNSIQKGERCPMEDGEILAQTTCHSDELNTSSFFSSNKRTNDKQGGRGGRRNASSLSPSKARKLVNSFDKVPKEYSNSDNRTKLSESQWNKDHIRYQGNEEQLLSFPKIEDKTTLIHDCEAKELAYHQLIVENYYLPVAEQGFTTAFRTEALRILFPLLDIHQADFWGVCMSLLILRMAGFDEYASHPLLPDMTKAVDTTNKGSYIHYRLSCLNEDIFPLTINEWKDMPGNAIARQAVNFSIWTAYDTRTDTSHIEYERVLHRLKFVHPSNSVYSLWYISANINRERSMFDQVHNFRNPCYIIIQEYKNITDAKKNIMESRRI